ncbi:hypothetical protein MBLNU459_g0432t1 [Dothideomycetes sp. NU459]
MSSSTTTISSSSPNKNDDAPPPANSKGEGAYPLTANNLTSLVSYNGHPAGISIVSRVALPAGAVFTPITTATPAPAKRWSSVQTGADPDRHIELNSALLYMNHSCAPSLEVDATRMEVRVARGRDLAVGDDLTFFYPSTEWEFSRPFECLCGAGEGVCVGRVEGAKAFSEAELERWFVNEHILAMVKARDEKKK